MNWISFRQLHEDIAEFALKVPDDVVGIVGIPRSGMMVASLLAMHLHLPVGMITDDGAFVGAGARIGWRQQRKGRILIVDDSLHSGHSIQTARERIKVYSNPALTAALYVRPDMTDAVDLYHRVLPLPRIFAWNWATSAYLHNWAADIDGVLCYDPAVVDDDGPEYKAALVNARPLHLVRRKIGGLITGRLGRWEPVTRAWLDKHGIEAHDLAMHPAETAAARRAGNVAQWKGKKYRQSLFSLFFESTAQQAPVIARVSGKPVICLENERIYQ